MNIHDNNKEVLKATFIFSFIRDIFITNPNFNGKYNNLMRFNVWAIMFIFLTLKLRRR